MCWAFRIASNVDLAIVNKDDFEGFGGHIVGSGHESVMITFEKGKLVAKRSRYGMMLSDALGKRRLFWHARDDRVHEAPTWTNLLRQRMIVPVTAYAEGSGKTEIWMAGPAAFMVGLYKDDPRDGGFVVLTEASGTDPEGRRPILVDTEAATKWLKDPEWDATENLSKARRSEFVAVDLFESKRLSVDARNPPASFSQAA